jgi:organic hydroperoxide reductase OsmC/OhrA
MDPFPHAYEVGLKWTGGREGTLSAPGRPELFAGPPPEFDGKEDQWSPEHLLLASVDLCLMTTYFSLSARKGLETRAYASKTTGKLDKTADGLLFTEIRHAVTVSVAEADREKAQALMASAKKYCLIANSLKTPVSLELTVETV